MKNITVDEFIEKFTINPARDIEPFFNLTKSIEVESHNGKCYNCEDGINRKSIPSSPWTGVQHCWKCNHLNVIYYSDRMSGARADTVKCYTNKK